MNECDHVVGVIRRTQINLSAIVEKDMRGLFDDVYHCCPNCNHEIPWKENIEKWDSVKEAYADKENNE